MDFGCEPFGDNGPDTDLCPTTACSSDTCTEGICIEEFNAFQSKNGCANCPPIDALSTDCPQDQIDFCAETCGVCAGCLGGEACKRPVQPGCSPACTDPANECFLYVICYTCDTE